MAKFAKNVNITKYMFFDSMEKLHEKSEISNLVKIGAIAAFAAASFVSMQLQEKAIVQEPRCQDQKIEKSMEDLNFIPYPENMPYKEKKLTGNLFSQATQDTLAFFSNLNQVSLAYVIPQQKYVASNDVAATAIDTGIMIFYSKQNSKYLAVNYYTKDNSNIDASSDIRSIKAYEMPVASGKAFAVYGFMEIEFSSGKQAVAYINQPTPEEFVHNPSKASTGLSILDLLRKNLKDDTSAEDFLPSIDSNMLGITKFGNKRINGIEYAFGIMWFFDKKSESIKASNWYSKDENVLTYNFSQGIANNTTFLSIEKYAPYYIENNKTGSSVAIFSEKVEANTPAGKISFYCYTNPITENAIVASINKKKDTIFKLAPLIIY
ncbi:MAG: hypothetical protein QW045_02745 [Candidatus Micrarchaeaceae archaeon]